MRHSSLIYGGLAVVSAGAIYLGSAYWSAAGFESAAKAGDADKISNMADMASIKEGLKSQVSAALAKKSVSNGSNSDNAMTGLAALFVSAVADKMIDAFVTPDGLAAIMKGGRPGHSDGTIKDDGTLTQSSSDFLDIDHFRVKVSKQGGGTTSLTFERRGIITWKLVRIALPADLLEDKPSPVTAPVAAPPQAQGPLLSLPAGQTHPVKDGEDWAQVIPASTRPADAEDCDRPVLEKQTASLDGGVCLSAGLPLDDLKRYHSGQAVGREA
ncbi:MAG TPA: DUF2939 domain-containing protein [Novosphingobium sp.]|nr:DUF2939 domain-containing protein [Novosphingobium sp.]